jgi:hypothetical protein
MTQSMSQVLCGYGLPGTVKRSITPQKHYIAPTHTVHITTVVVGSITTVVYLVSTVHGTNGFPKWGTRDNAILRVVFSHP